MGVIYCVTMLYAVSEHVANSTVFGTWPILANFYGTFAIASSVGGAVTGCVEMARGCTIGTLLAIATVEITVAACGNQNFGAMLNGSTSTPSTRRLLDGVAMPVPRRSTEPALPRHHREMTLLAVHPTTG